MLWLSRLVTQTFHACTWSEHQYHMEGTDMPMRMPGQGRSELTGSLNMWKASSRGMPQVEFGTRTDGIALPYPSIKAFQPPTSTKPQQRDGRVRRYKAVMRAGRVVALLLTEDHEGEWSGQHDNSLSSICVDDCSQTTWETTSSSQWHTGDKLHSHSMCDHLSFQNKQCVTWWSQEGAHLLQCREQWLTAAARQQGRCSTVRPAEWTMHLHTCPPVKGMHTLALIPLQEHALTYADASFLEKIVPGTKGFWFMCLKMGRN